MEIGLLFGSFNPIHVGHLFVAEMALESGHIDEVWFVVSPASPYKMDKDDLAYAGDRLQMVEIACAYNPKFSVSSIEYELPSPSYTYITFEELKKDFPAHEFYFICGTDVYVDIPNWTGGKEVIEACSFLVYPRNTTTNYTPESMADKTIFLNGVPSLEISSTFLRKQIKNKRTTKHLLPENVKEYIETNNLYK
jgi:nicotinate-nucleotide adenylyltransferase